MVVYTLGTGHYLSSRGGRRIFVATTEHLRFPPLQCGFDSPTLTVEDFMILPLLSQSSQKARVAICKQVTSILILTSQEPWTTTSHIWSSDMNWIVREGIVWRDYGEGLLFSSKLLKTNSLSLSSSSLSNSSSFPLHLLIPRHFLLCHHTIRLCSQTLWCVGNNDISGRSQVLLPLIFRSCHSQGCCI